MCFIAIVSTAPLLSMRCKVLAGKENGRIMCEPGRWRVLKYWWTICLTSGKESMESENGKSLVKTDSELIACATTGDLASIALLFERHREKIKRMITIRMDRRLSTRIDASDVLQETWLDCERRFADFISNESITFFAWLRLLAAQRLVDLHRVHLGAQMRSIRNEVHLYTGTVPSASSISLAEQLVGNLTSASHAAQRGEIQIRIQEALNNMEPIDREVLELRHFEMLTNEETAAVLGLKKAAASNRYVRALKRLRLILDEYPGQL